MINLLHKKNGQTYPVTPEAFDKIKARPNWSATYTVISSPETPKEIVSKAKAKKPAEFEQDGFTSTDALPVVEDAGEEQ